MFITQFNTNTNLTSNHFHKFILINNGCRIGLSINRTVTTVFSTLDNWGKYLPFRLELIK